MQRHSISLPHNLLSLLLRPHITCPSPRSALSLTHHEALQDSVQNKRTIKKK
ncbi:hypothetical protein E2C01_094561 [Portunus trituberculatus]|uniref:Uncharacterized protein n=1 Tax=Portunus trituberculatus TaxID=210409 RepID=A0A5B7K3H4_PORTR|nr:hypothetical protein [Portunus trituberculatus]